MKTEFRKSPSYGWIATTDIEIGDMVDAYGRPAKRVLQIKTINYKPLITFVSVKEHATDERGVVWGTFKIGDDFYKTLKTHDAKRVTEKAVKLAHESTMDQWEAVKAEAIAHYAANPQTA